MAIGGVDLSIENMLRCVGYTALTQETLIFEYIRQYPKPLMLQGGGDARLLQRHQILGLYRCEQLPDANFNTFSKMTESLLQGAPSGWSFKWLNNINDDDSYIEHIKQSIASDLPTLISVETTGAWHIMVVFAYDGEVIKAYDPALDDVLYKSTEQFKFSNDIVVLEKTGMVQFYGC
ncbi:MAG: hypothetical protein AAGJ35_06675 [Myxococcota bacterium]